MRAAENTSLTESAPDRDGPIREVARPAGRFGLHLLGMCVVMCVAMGLLAVLYFGAATLMGFSDVRQQAPELSALVVAAVLGASMMAWMRFRRMEWRPTLEMAGSAIGAGVLMIVGYWLGVVPESTLIQSVCGVACVAMVAVMLFRFRVYSSHTGHHAHAGI
jgi:uncharacterized membrane protein YfcA